MFDEEIKYKILKILKERGGRIITKVIKEELKVPEVDIARCLYELSDGGFIKKEYTKEYDPTRPFDTVTWALTNKSIELEKGLIKHEYLGRKAKLTKEDRIDVVMTYPTALASFSRELLNDLEILEFSDIFETLIYATKSEVKIISPFIDELMLYPLVKKLNSNPSIRVNILTETDKNLYNIMHPGKFVTIKKLTKREKNKKTKIYGVHAKLIIIDEDVALLGSFNLTRTHLTKNFDLGLLIKDKRIVKKLDFLFKKLFEKAIEIEISD